MGSPLSQILADIVLDDLETSCLKKLNFQLLFFKRYVDDFITCVPITEINKVLQIFNSYHDRLKFTYELQNHGKISFLDILLIRKGNTIITDWFQKPTFSGRLLNYNSNHPIQQKISIIYNTIDKALGLSHPSFREKNIKFAVNIFLANDYPIKFIKKYI